VDFENIPTVFFNPNLTNVLIDTEFSGESDINSASSSHIGLGDLENHGKSRESKMLQVCLVVIDR
jgi:hypothetical protein